MELYGFHDDVLPLDPWCGDEEADGKRPLYDGGEMVLNLFAVASLGTMRALT